MTTNSPQTPESVALNLMEKIFAVQGKTFQGPGNRDLKAATPQEILDTYAKCIAVVSRVSVMESPKFSKTNQYEDA